jgi:predicted nucleic acid-binding protein
MMAPPFLDTNVLVRHFTQDHADHSPRASQFLRQFAQAKQRVRTADTVIVETVFLLEKQYRQPKATIRANVLPLLTLPGIILPGKERFQKVFDYYVNRNLPFADAYHIALMEDEGMTEIISFDEDFDRIPGITRIEP